MKDAGQKRYAVSPFFCPRCDKPADVLIAGVCQSCKSLLETQHGGATKKSPKYNYLEEHHIQPDARFSENGTRVQTTADNMEGENFIHSFCAELGFNFALAVEIVAFAQQRCSNEIIIQIREIADKFHFNFELSAEIVSFIDKHYKNKHNGVAEEKLREFFERDKAATARGLNYPGDVRMYLRMMALRKGYYDIAGGDGVVSVSKKCGTKKHGVSKATGEKCFSVVESAMNLPQYPPLPLLPNQRSKEQKKTMSNAQKIIWHKPNKL